MSKSHSKIGRTEICYTIKLYQFLYNNETWLNSSVMDNEIDILGYILFRQDRNDGYCGVALCIKVSYMPVRFSIVV